MNYFILKMTVSLSLMAIALGVVTVLLGWSIWVSVIVTWVYTPLLIKQLTKVVDQRLEELKNAKIRVET